MRLKVIGSIFLYKKRKNDFEENKFNERFGECVFFTSKDPISLSVMLYVSMYKGNKSERTLTYLPKV